MGNSLEDVKASLAKVKNQEVRKAYKTLQRFIESHSYLEQAKKRKLHHNEYLSQELLEKIEACKLHWQQVFSKYDVLTKKEYFKKFIIEFTFNTTSIEGNTITLREAYKLLSEDTTPKNKTLREIHDVQNTERVFLKIIDHKLKLTNETIITFHKELLKDIDFRTGYRTGDVHVIHARFASTPAPYVKTDMDIILKLYQKMSDIHPLVLASLFHHKFEKTHPFFDGNGRVGRILLNIILLNKDYPPIIIQKKARAVYLNALAQADAAGLTSSDAKAYRPLIEFLAAQYIEGYWNMFL